MMDMKLMSANLARIAYLIAHQIPTNVCPESRVTGIVGIDIESLEHDEKAALEAFSRARRPVSQLLTDRNDPPIENDWWG